MKTLNAYPNMQTASHCISDLIGLTHLVDYSVNRKRLLQPIKRTRQANAWNETEMLTCLKISGIAANG